MKRNDFHIGLEFWCGGLIESGLAAREQEKKRFLQLADDLVRARDPEAQSRLKEELARMTFADLKALIAGDLAKLEEALAAAGAPWTPGRRVP